MAMSTYLPTKNLSPLWKFVQYSTSTSVSAGCAALATALSGEYSDLSIQVLADTTTGKTDHALVIVNEARVINVAPDSFVGFNEGNWETYAAAELDGSADSKFTAYSAT